MSNQETMTVIYFTDGALIEDLHIRKSLLRIPEIITCLRENQKEFLNCDLFIAMMDQQVFNYFNYHQKIRLKTLLQQALFQRWLRQGVEPDLIVRRCDYADFSQLAATFAKLSTIEPLKVLTIGPGFDDLEAFLRLQLKLKSCPLYDIISQDPMLGWFWEDIKNGIQLHS
jgi:L-rhamnose mutarotase